MLSNKTGKQNEINTKILMLILVKIIFIKQKTKAHQIIFKINTLYSIIPRNLLLKL